MSAAGADGFVGWLLAAIDGVMDAERVGPDAAGSVRAELAKFAGAGGVRALRACRNGGRVDAMLAEESGSRWAVVAGLDDRDMVAFMWVQREPAAFAGVPGGLVVVLNGPSSSGKSTLATAIQQAAGTPWIRLLPDEFCQWHLPERYGAFGRAAGPWQEGFFAMLAGLARAGNQVITCAAGLDGQAGWRRRLAGIGCLFTGLTPALAVCEQRERERDDRAAGNAARQWPAVHQGRAYDLDIDTGAVDPWRAAALVLAALADGKARAVAGIVPGLSHVPKGRLARRLRPARNQVVRVPPDGVTSVPARPDAEHPSSGPQLRRRCEGRNTSGPGTPADQRCRVAGGRVTPREPSWPKITTSSASCATGCRTPASATPRRGPR